MDLKTDSELIELHRQGSQEAFAELVRRHINWIYSTARRRVRDEHLAEDITQATFAVLARKLPRLNPTQPLSAWLFHVVTLASKAALRTESRRKHHETEAAKMRNHDQLSQADSWESLAPDLDELVGRLHSTDREAVLLRFYEQKSFEEIATALGITEVAARKRVTRATERLRQRFADSGRELLASELAGALLANLVVPVQPSLSAAVSTGCASQPAAINAATLAGKVVAVMRLKFCIPAIAAIVISTPLAIGIAVTMNSDNKQAVATPTTRPIPSSPAPEIEKELIVPEDSVIDLDSGEFLALPKDVKWFDYGRRLSWTKPIGGDVWVHTLGNPHDDRNTPSDLGGLFGSDMALLEVDESLWQRSDFSDVSGKLLSKNILLDQAMRPMNRFPRTYLFKTRQGGVGILQTLRFEQSPRAAVVRFKTWKSDPPR